MKQQLLFMAMAQLSMGSGYAHAEGGDAQPTP